MRISVFGLGYVGTVTAACLAAGGHKVVGVDVAPDKVESINGGRSPIIERDIDRVISKGVNEGFLRATSETEDAIAESDLAIVCVGTPSSENGSLDTQYVERVSQQIGAALSRTQKKDFLFVLRSTVLPGTTRKIVIPILEQAAGRAAGDGYDVAFYPEFLREGSSVEDFHHPPKIVVGERAAATSQALEQLYAGIQAPRFVTTIEMAEMVKYADNSFHAVKITFANEVGRICRALGIDGRGVMEIFCADRLLNISPAYLRPGFAFGGSCLPKDVRALVYQARHSDLDLPLLEGVMASNSKQVERVFRRIESYRPERVGLSGLAFKPGTDDLRESPLVSLAERLLGRGYKLSIYDLDVKAARLVGGNRAYVEQHLPHLSRLLVSSLDDLSDCDTIVIGHPLNEESRLDRWLEDGKRVLDLVGKQARASHPGYEGLHW
ncbi:MAG TPA: nucleotide sugar dehydrogenase [Blastocatellia bacterium]|nr:nucleotide sugar dehydrogenase [Blastocatellia bacterium]